MHGLDTQAENVSYCLGGGLISNAKLTELIYLLCFIDVLMVLISYQLVVSYTN